MTQQQPDYYAYLLRLWRDDGETWRASLESSLSGRQRRFVCLADLFAFLEEQIGSAAQTEDEATAAPSPSSSLGGR